MTEKDIDLKLKLSLGAANLPKDVLETLLSDIDNYIKFKESQIDSIINERVAEIFNQKIEELRKPVNPYLYPSKDNNGYDDYKYDQGLGSYNTIF